MSYLSTHQELFKSLNTAPDHDFWTGIWCVGTVVGRSAYVDLPTPVFLNPIIYLSSNKGLGKEQLATDISEEIINNVLPNSIIAKTTQVSTELRNSPTGQVAFTTAGIFRRSSGANIRTIVDVASCPLEYDRTRNPYITVLSPIKLDEAMALDERLWPLSICVSRRMSKDGPKRELPERAQLAKAIDQLGEVRQYARGRELWFTGEAKTFLNNFIRTLEWSPLTASANPSHRYVLAFNQAIYTHVVRVAAIRALSDLRDLVSEEDVTDALGRVLIARRYGSFLYAQARPHGIVSIEKMRAVLLSSPNGISHKALYMQVRHALKSHEYNAFIAVMREAGAINSWHLGKRGGRYYIATDKLKNRELWNTILVHAGYGVMSMEEE